MKTTTAIVAAAGLAFTTLASADSDWAAAVSGPWGTASNWNPMDVPDTVLETATLALGPTAYIATLDGNYTIGGLVMTNPNAMIDIPGSRTLAIGGGLFTNAGTIRVNSNNSAANATLAFDASAATTAGGRIQLLRQTNARLTTGAGAVLTNNATIDGVGVIAAALINNALVSSDASGVLELNTNDMINTGTMRAAAASVLQIDSITIDNTGGLIEGADGTVRFPGGVHRIENGTLDTTAFGQFQIDASGDLTLASVTHTGLMNIDGAGEVLVEGNLTNDGTILVNRNNSAANARLVFTTDGTVSGSGVLRLGRVSNAILDTDPGMTVTIGASQTVSGLGRIPASLINSGLVDADVPGAIIELAGEDKTNHGLMRAGSGATLNITGTVTTQSAPGVIRADAGTVRVASGATGVTGGSIEVVNGGEAHVEGSGTLTLVNVDLLGGFNIQGAGTIVLDTTLTNNAFLVVNSNNSAANALLTTAGDVAIDGNGTIRLARDTNAILSTAPASTLIVGSGQTISGLGQIQARLVNNGVVHADFGGGTINLNTENKVNNNLMMSSNAGTLNISGVTTTQAPGATLRADGGTILVTSGPATRVEEGSLETLNGGVARVLASGNLTLNAVDLSGDLNIEGAGVVVIDSTISNDGTIVVNSNNSAANATLTTVADASVTGTGEIVLGRASNAQLNSAGGATLTLGSGQTVRGTGVINATLVNNGIVDADSAGQAIDLRTGIKTNNGTMRATLGVLDISASTTNQFGSGAMVADGGEIRTSGASRVEGGSLSTLNGSVVTVNAPGNLTLKNVAFSGQAEIAGAGTISVENTLTNNGTIVVNDNNSAAHAFLSVADGGSLSGTGTVLLARATNAKLTTPGTANFRVNQTLAGIGDISGTWTQRGTISPGSSVGTITNSGTINMMPTARFELELDSTASFDRFTGSGNVAIDGELDISFLGYTQHKNDVFRFITGSTVTGRFASVNGPVLTDGLVYGIFYAPTYVELRITCGPDLNLDGLLDFFDVLYFLGEYSAGNPDGDFNKDGVFDFFDVLAFLQAFSAGCP